MTYFPKNSVVVPVDFSPESLAAVDVALSLAASPQSLHIIHVLIDITPLEAGEVWGVMDPQARLEQTEKYLKEKLADSKYQGADLAVLLGEPVEVLRGGWGIPHIYARNQDDLFFAQGFVTAQDRLFQIDLWRRIGSGQTAELFGERAIDADRFARLMQYRGDMKAEWQSYA